MLLVFALPEDWLRMLNFLKTSNMATDDETPMLGSKRTIIGHNDEILDLKIIPEENIDEESVSAVIDYYIERRYNKHKTSIIVIL